MPLQPKLIHKAIKGDRPAQQQLFEQLYAPMFRVCNRFITSREDAEDCLMKGFLKTFQNLQQFQDKGEGSFQAWVRKIMTNECLMFLRGRNNFLLFTEEEPVEISLPADVLLKADAEELNAMIMQLPVGYRTVFNLYSVEGYSHKEIAELMGTSESTSKTQLSKARVRLKNLLDQKKEAYANLGK